MRRRREQSRRAVPCSRLGRDASWRGATGFGGAGAAGAGSSGRGSGQSGAPEHANPARVQPCQSRAIPARPHPQRVARRAAPVAGQPSTPAQPDTKVPPPRAARPTHAGGTTAQRRVAATTAVHHRSTQSSLRPTPAPPDSRCGSNAAGYQGRWFRISVSGWQKGRREQTRRTAAGAGGGTGRSLAWPGCPPNLPAPTVIFDVTPLRPNPINMQPPAGFIHDPARPRAPWTRGPHTKTRADVEGSTLRAEYSRKYTAQTRPPVLAVKRKLATGRLASQRPVAGFRGYDVAPCFGGAHGTFGEGTADQTRGGAGRSRPSHRSTSRLAINQPRTLTQSTHTHATAQRASSISDLPCPAPAPRLTTCPALRATKIHPTALVSARASLLNQRAATRRQLKTPRGAQFRTRPPDPLPSSPQPGPARGATAI